MPPPPAPSATDAAPVPVPGSTPPPNDDHAGSLFRRSMFRLSLRGSRPSIATPPPTASPPAIASPVTNSGGHLSPMPLAHGSSYSSASSVRSVSSTGLSSVVETTNLVKTVDDVSGTKQINNYLVLQELGRGVHGKVKLARRTDTGELVAMKILRKTTRTRRLGFANLNRLAASPMGDNGIAAAAAAAANSQLEKIRREIAIMKKLRHPNVVQLYEVIDDPSSDKVYIVLEYLAGGEIKWKRAAPNADSSGHLPSGRPAPTAPLLSVDEARAIFRDVVAGLEYLHSQGIIHRDVKPANLIRGADGRVKLSDFGVSHFSPRQFQKEQKEIARRRSSLNLSAAATSSSVSPAAAMAMATANVAAAKKEPRLKLRKSRKSLTSPSPSQTPPPPPPPISTSIPSPLGDSTDNDALDGSNSFNDDEELAKTAGSPAFFAPELCVLHDEPSSAACDVAGVDSPSSARPTRPPITKAIDIWAAGVTLYCLVFGCCPFVADSEFELFERIPVQPLTFPEDMLPLDPDLEDLFRRVLDKNPETRATLADIKHHPWVRRGMSETEYADWLAATDPVQYEVVEVSDAEVREAVSSGLMERIKRQWARLSVSLLNVAGSGSGARHRATSMPSVNPLDAIPPRPTTAPAAYDSRGVLDSPASPASGGTVSPARGSSSTRLVIPTPRPALFRSLDESLSPSSSPPPHLVPSSVAATPPSTTPLSSRTNSPFRRFFSVRKQASKSAHVLSRSPDDATGSNRGSPVFRRGSAVEDYDDSDEYGQQHQHQHAHDAHLHASQPGRWVSAADGEGDEDDDDVDIAALEEEQERRRQRTWASEFDDDVLASISTSHMHVGPDASRCTSPSFLEDPDEDDEDEDDDDDGLVLPSSSAGGRRAASAPVVAVRPWPALVAPIPLDKSQYSITELDESIVDDDALAPMRGGGSTGSAGAKSRLTSDAPTLPSRPSILIDDEPMVDLSMDSLVVQRNTRYVDPDEDDQQGQEAPATLPGSVGSALGFAAAAGVGVASGPSASGSRPTNSD
ncbi:hypothetical protein GGF32_007615 [Allomyces javanicus]|nr:hypothetical protein GGF32_007615 [Allomyces javanicus]